MGTKVYLGILVFISLIVNEVFTCLLANQVLYVFLLAVKTWMSCFTSWIFLSSTGRGGYYTFHKILLFREKDLPLSKYLLSLVLDITLTSVAFGAGHQGEDRSIQRSRMGQRRGLLKVETVSRNLDGEGCCLCIW